MKLDHIAKRFRIDKPDKFRLAKHDPAECCGLTVDKKDAKVMLADGIERLSDLQERLYADDRWSVLIVLQAMDAAGKDSIIKHVMSGINPQGVRGAFLQAAERGGTGARFPLARGAAAADQRPHRHFQPLALRGSADGARASRIAANARTCRSSSSARTSGSSVSTTSALSSAIWRATAR